MIEATRRRLQTGPHGTFGLLVLPGLDSPIVTAELPWRGNVRSASCIPPGTYACTRVRSPRFGRVYGLHDVPGRSAILIHRGNFAGDVIESALLDSDSRGCILAGLRFAVLRNSHGRQQRAVSSSAAAMRQLDAVLGDQPMRLNIT
ncbi:MAG: DUF5675 family protein [Alphaproteobacteria bacterium]